MQQLQSSGIQRIKVVDDMFHPEENEVYLAKVTAEYEQSLDCCQLEKDYPEGCQTLTMTTEDGGGGKFIRINTGKAGWSINNAEEFADLINDFIKRFECE